MDVRARVAGDSIALTRYRTLRALGILLTAVLGFRFAAPQALRSHPLRGLRR